MTQLQYQSPPPPGNAAERVKLPAIFLMAAGAIAVFLQLLGLVLRLLGIGLMAAAAGARPMTTMEGNIQMLSGGIGLVVGLISLLVGVLIIVGGFKMMKLQSYSVAMAASIAALIPCVSPCCFLTLGFGIWALVVLLKPEIKAAFIS